MCGDKPRSLPEHPIHPRTHSHHWVRNIKVKYQSSTIHLLSTCIPGRILTIHLFISYSLHKVVRDMQNTEIQPRAVPINAIE
jgi:hypothetical protein